MTERLISADNHIDMTYCPPDLWTDAARAFAPLARERFDNRRSAAKLVQLYTREARR